MTPAIVMARQAGIEYEIHEYRHDVDAGNYGAEAARKLGVDPARVFKTLVARMDTGALVVGIVPVLSQLDLKGLAKALGAKKVTMAPVPDVERTTGYVLGGVSPLGQKKPLKTVIDSSAGKHHSVFVSAGRRGLEIELAPDDLAELTGAAFRAIAQSS